jgi:CheY-like chemotaxis protein
MSDTYSIKTQKKRIVIVEDDYILASLIQLQLQRMGYFVTDIFSTGEEILERLSHTMADLILMDIELSGKIDGVEAAIEINKQTNIPVIFVTGNSDHHTKTRAEQAEHKELLFKPLSATELGSAIHKALSSTDI